MTDRRIYVACLASYNNGVLHGAWIYTEGKDADDLQDEVNKILRSSRYPNVEVDCPECEGEGGHFETMGLPASVAGQFYTTPRQWVVCDCCKGSGKVSSAEEFAIHDHEGLGGRLGEYTSLREVAELDAMLEEHGDAFLAFLEAFGVDEDQWDKFEEAYYGQADSEKAFAEDFAVESGAISESSPMFGYIDWEHYWNGELRHAFTIQNGYVFRSDW
ncbi:antirestriction protein ArdA [Cupriavidus basilensis]|uniref:antirestriction protein ArdA n=1 Tax=Cupriavidus basilensis TaxID=68895 RepID=UPI0020A6B715|nr:antirestriction protein ArdA [Cupriavidus basilensis]MCP3017438.1 antirestriction protein ArdA [Cupriavidus basilensis]